MSKKFIEVLDNDGKRNRILCKGAVTDTREITNFHVICVLGNCLGRVLGDKGLCSSMYALSNLSHIMNQSLQISRTNCGERKCLGAPNYLQTKPHTYMAICPHDPSPKTTTLFLYLTTLSRSSHPWPQKIQWQQSW